LLIAVACSSSFTLPPSPLQAHYFTPPPIL
jgi:hypothetical protein